MGKRTVHILGGNASGTTFATEQFDTDDASNATRTLAKSIRHSSWITFKEELRIDVLAQLTKWYDTEFGIMACPGYLKDCLILKAGEEGGEGLGGMVSGKGAPQGSYFLLHTHPTHKSYRHHFDVDVRNSARWEAVIDLELTVIAFCGTTFANRKDQNTSAYVSIECSDDNWPCFLTKTVRKSVCISPKLYYEDYNSKKAEIRVRDSLCRCAEFLAVQEIEKADKCYQDAERMLPSSSWPEDLKKISDAITVLREYNAAMRDKQLVGAANLYRSAAQTMRSFGVYLR